MKKQKSGYIREPKNMSAISMENMKWVVLIGFTLQQSRLSSSDSRQTWGQLPIQSILQVFSTLSPLCCSSGLHS